MARQERGGTEAEGFRVKDAMLTVRQICDHLGVSDQVVRDWIKVGELDALHFAGSIGYRVKQTDYDRFLRARYGAAAVAAARERTPDSVLAGSG